ncbi:MAG: hypothetical protein WD360_06355 [Nitriliruptoraceae bacterium]
MADSNQDAPQHVLGPQGAARAVVGVLLGIILGAVIAVITPRRER